jgi:hypothetical protein
MMFGKFAEVYKQRHVLAKGLALSSTIDSRLKPLIERFGDRPIAEIKTADIDDFAADLNNRTSSTVWTADSASPTTKVPPGNPSEVTDQLLVGNLVAVRGIEPRSRG